MERAVQTADYTTMDLTASLDVIAFFNRSTPPVDLTSSVKFRFG